jgi:outer membrane protein TolC
VKSENRKLAEAEQRFRAGRTDTDQLIQFEAELASAELAYELQRIELARRDRKLALLRGSLWEHIRLPEYQLPELQLHEEGR